MKLKQLLSVSIVTGAVLAGGLNVARAEDSVIAKAKLSKGEAQKIALEKVPGGKVTEGELEMEAGVLIWSFDVAMEGTKNTTEVNINAVTGKIVGIDVETPADQAKEKEADKKEAAQKKLEAKAKISEAKAREIALDKVPNGKIKEGELEEEKGKLIWSFDIATEGSKNITEVNVDAITGKVIAVDVETPADQAKEAAADAKEKGAKAVKEDDDKDDKK